jgi:outer membrane protein OmpA-like peptidoglycan-associated protein
MGISFMETVKNYFTSEFINQSAVSLDESSSGVSKALSAIIPAGLAGILNKATSGNDGAQNVYSMAKDAAGYFSASPNLAKLHNEEEGSNLPSDIFGNNESHITNAIAKYAGIQQSSAGSLITLALPVIMGLLGKHLEENNLSASGLSGFLSSQKGNIINAMPSGLPSLAGILGLGDLAGASMATSYTISLSVENTDEVAATRKGGMKWLLPLILIAAVIALLIYFSKGCNKPANDQAPPADTSSNTTTMDTSSKMNSGTKESIKVKLPNGKELDAFKGGIEDHLVTFLSGDWKSLSSDSLKNKWFDFDNLNFNINQSTLKPESEKQLDNISEILKAFPDAKIKIGGYTDSSGNASANKKLSQDRADATKMGLAKRGVGAQVISAEGYGSQFAKASPTAPDNERALDRHVSVSVRK